MNYECECRFTHSFHEGITSDRFLFLRFFQAVPMVAFGFMDNSAARRQHETAGYYLLMLSSWLGNYPLVN